MDNKSLEQLREERKEKLKNKDWQGAIKVLKEMIVIEETASRYANLGNLQLKIKDYKEAKKNFRKALEINPEHTKALAGLAKIERVLKGEEDSHNSVEVFPSLEGKPTNAPSASQVMKVAGENLKQLFTKDVPEEFGRYEIKSLLGKGGMGRVYKAYDPELKRYIALKTLREKDNEVLVRRFAKEATAIAQLQHSNIVRIHDVGNIENNPYFTMDFIEGTDLATFIKKQNYSIKKAVTILQKVADAMEYAHSKGIIHRDLKPRNIVLNEKEEPFILDFGLALIGEEDTRLSRTGAAIGTPEYMAVEQVLGKKDLIDERTDVYALGIILYEMITAKRPFVGDSSFEVMREVTDKKPTPPRQLNSKVSRELEKVCLKAIEKQREGRYQSVSEFVGELVSLDCEKKPGIKEIGGKKREKIVSKVSLLKNKLIEVKKTKKWNVVFDKISSLKNKFMEIKQYSIILFIFLCFAITLWLFIKSFQEASKQKLYKNLIAYYTFEGNAKDVSGCGLDGVVKGANC